MTQKAEIFIVQRELADQKDYPPDGLYETLPGFHGSGFEADAQIAGERAEAAFLDEDTQVFRIVKLVGDVVKVDRLPEGEE